MIKSVYLTLETKVMKTVAITKDNTATLLRENNEDLTKVGLSSSYKEKKHHTEVEVVNEKLWFFAKIKHQINELKNVKRLGEKEYKLQNK